MNDLQTRPNPRWLIVDDDHMIVELVRLILEEEVESEVQGFFSGAEAWDSIAAQPSGVELVITDRDMPGCDGLELSRKIRDAAPLARVILITGHHDDLNIESLREYGIHALLPKPFTCEQLVEMIRELLPAAITPSRASHITAVFGRCLITTHHRS